MFYYVTKTKYHHDPSAKRNKKVFIKQITCVQKEYRKNTTNQNVYCYLIVNEKNLSLYIIRMFHITINIQNVSSGESTEGKSRNIFTAKLIIYEYNKGGGVDV